MEELIELGRAFVKAMRDRDGLSMVDKMYSDDAESIEAVVPPNRYVRIAGGKDAIKAKREDWLKSFKIDSLDADGPYVHPPNRFAVRFEAEVSDKTTGEKKSLSEIAIYSVIDGKIMREEFFMSPR